MKKVFQTMYGLFRKSTQNISNSLDPKESDRAAQEFIDKSTELKNQIQQKIQQEIQEKIAQKIANGSKVAKANTSAKRKKNSSKVSKKSLSKSKASKTTKKVVEKTKLKKTISKKSTKNSSNSLNTKEKSKDVFYPKGLIAHSKVLDSVEKGYLELAGFKTYSDVFENLDTPKKRSKVAKEVTTTATNLNKSLNKIKLMMIKGLAEQSASILCQVGITSIEKLQKANHKEISTKILKLKKMNKELHITISSLQLERFIKEANSLN